MVSIRVLKIPSGVSLYLEDGNKVSPLDGTEESEGSWASQGNHNAKSTCSLVGAKKRMANGLD